MTTPSPDRAVLIPAELLETVVGAASPRPDLPQIAALRRARALLNDPPDPAASLPASRIAPHHNDLERRSTSALEVLAGDCWDHAPMRCPQCGWRHEFRCELSVTVGADSLPLTIYPLPLSPRTPVECGHCWARADFASYLPPWTEPANSSVDGTSCGCRQTLTDTDREDEARWLRLSERTRRAEEAARAAWAAEVTDAG